MSWLAGPGRGDPESRLAWADCSKGSGVGWGLGYFSRGRCSDLWLEGKVSSREPVVPRTAPPRARALHVTCHWGPARCDQVPSGRTAPLAFLGVPSVGRSRPRAPPRPSPSPRDASHQALPARSLPPPGVGGRACPGSRAPPTDARETACLPPPLIIVPRETPSSSGNPPAGLAL